MSFSPFFEVICHCTVGKLSVSLCTKRKIIGKEGHILHISCLVFASNSGYRISSSTSASADAPAASSLSSGSDTCSRLYLAQVDRSSFTPGSITAVSAGAWAGATAGAGTPDPEPSCSSSFSEEEEEDEAGWSLGEESKGLFGSLFFKLQKKAGNGGKEEEE